MSEIDVHIDELTNSIVHQPTGKVFATRIVPWDELTADQRAGFVPWQFDWASEANSPSREVVALLAEGTETIQGLLSLEIREGFIFAHPIENAPHNVGGNRLYHGVAGNLFAYACARSFALGFDGYVSLDAKTELIEHYRKSLGAKQVGKSQRMFLETDAANQLVNRYFVKEIDQWP